MNIKLTIDKVKLALMKRTGSANNKKTITSWKDKHYNNAPRISFVIQSHNKSLQVCQIVDLLRKCPDSEIIVMDDGSTPEHTKRIAAHLTGANEFMLRANDLYENVMYDRAIRMANARYVALLQDDDIFDNMDWAEEALRLFAEHPQMAILGGMDGLHIVFPEGRIRGESITAGTTEFRFVEAVNRAPMWIDRELFLKELKHIDFSLAPYQYDDYELCMRAWLCGLQVGWYKAGGRSLSVGGMRLWNNKVTAHLCVVNGKNLNGRYADKIEGIRKMVEEANKELKK